MKAISRRSRNRRIDLIHGFSHYSRKSKVFVIGIAAIALCPLLPANAQSTVDAVDAVGTAEASGSAGSATVTAIDRYVAEFDHPMGSQIVRVEGDASTRFSKIHALQPEGLNSDGAEATATVPGIDVSGHQKNVDWNSWWSQGKQFVYVKATESTTYKNPYFAQQYNGSYQVGMIRGAYHFATPDTSSGADQARYFINNGGGWSADGKTLPGALDMEYNPYGATCFDKSKSDMAAWIKDFSDTYQAQTGRYPVIYSSTSWWNQCVEGNFGSTNPLWVARYAAQLGPLPTGWEVQTIWQYSSTPIDQNSFNGSIERLRALATG